MPTKLEYRVLNIIFSHAISQFHSIRTGEFPLPDEGVVSFLSRVNQDKNLEILQPHLEQDVVQWMGNHQDYSEFKFLETERKSDVFQVFKSFKNTILENVDKIVNQEYASLKLEQKAKSFAALLVKLVEINNVKLFYSSEQNRTAIAYGFSFIDSELMDFAALISPDDLVDEPNLSSPIIPIAVEENELPELPELIIPVAKKNRSNKHPWWLTTIRSINWLAWKYWWLVWLLFILSFLLLYFFCPSKKKISNSTCNELNHIHKNIDTLNSGLLFCCDCNRKLLPEKPEPDTTQRNPPIKSPEPPKKAQNCNSFVQSGADGIDIQYVTLGTKSGRVVITYDMANEPDKLEVYYEGKRVASTFEIGGNRNGFVGGDNSAGSTGRLIFNFTYNKEDFVKVVLTGGTGTSWNYKISCPN